MQFGATTGGLPRQYLENYTSQLGLDLHILWEHPTFTSIALIPQPLLPNLGEGEPDAKSLSQAWERDLG
ncbi:MAG: hypothetical protein AAGG51_06095 [Cyanobacteria bacterium P01_G01_bin.54]